MRKNKILIATLSAVFAIVMVISVFMMFTVKKVEVDFTVYTDTDKTVSLQEQFNQFTGKNLIFFDTDKVEKVDVGPEFEITSVEKSFPNVIKVKVSERKARFSFEFGGKTYVISNQGYVLREAKEGENLLKINLSNVIANEPVLGQKLSSDHDEDLYNALMLADVEGVVDASKEMTVEYVGRTMRSVIFLTKTDVKIRIPMAIEYGDQKTSAGFTAYFNEDRDYIKSYNEIRVDAQKDGNQIRLNVVWVQQ